MNDKGNLSTADFVAVADREGAQENERPERAEALVEPEKSVALFASEESHNFRSQWEGIQAGFVDEPRRAVEQADSLVASVIKRLAEIFAEERSKLESDWGHGKDVSTEDLRQALRRYRSFFDRLLSV